MAKREVKIHGIYKHYKGNYYIVEDVATHTETGEKNGDLSCFVRRA